MRVNIRRVARPRSVVEVVHTLLHVCLVHREIVERRSVIRVAPHVARLYTLLPIRRGCGVAAAQKRARPGSRLVNGLIYLIYNEVVASIEHHVSIGVASIVRVENRVRVITFDVAVASIRFLDRIPSPLIACPVCSGHCDA
jgi:hypothetical protein